MKIINVKDTFGDFHKFSGDIFYIKSSTGLTIMESDDNGKNMEIACFSTYSWVKNIAPKDGSKEWKEKLASIDPYPLVTHPEKQEYIDPFALKQVEEREENNIKLTPKATIALAKSEYKERLEDGLNEVLKDKEQEEGEDETRTFEELKADLGKDVSKVKTKKAKKFYTDYIIKWVSPHSKFSVIRAHDNKELETNINTRAEAEIWVESLIKETDGKNHELTCKFCNDTGAVPDMENCDPVATLPCTHC